MNKMHVDFVGSAGRDWLELNFDGKLRLLGKNPPSLREGWARGA